MNVLLDLISVCSKACYQFHGFHEKESFRAVELLNFAFIFASFLFVSGCCFTRGRIAVRITIESHHKSLCCMFSVSSAFSIINS